MPALRVDDAGDPRLADYRELKDGALRRRTGVFVAEGRLVVRRLFDAGRFRVRSVLVTEAARGDLADVLDDGAAVYVASDEMIERVVGFNFHRGCLAAAERPAETGVASLLEGRLLVVLERVTNPDNIGGVFRNAMAFGADGVLLSPGCADPLYRKAVRVSMGGTLRVPFAVLAPWPDALASVRDAGFTVIALTPDARTDVAEIPVPERAALLFGAEGEGLSAGALAAAGLDARIAMAPGGHSLNVATASGVVLHRLAQKGD